jgi:hypothetical protein
MTKKAIIYSFDRFNTILQLDSKHKGINSVVKSTKKSEIPSIPNEKFKFSDETHAEFKIN